MKIKPRDSDPKGGRVASTKDGGRGPGWQFSGLLPSAPRDPPLTHFSHRIRNAVRNLAQNHKVKIENPAGGHDHKDRSVVHSVKFGNLYWEIARGGVDRR